MRATVQRIGWTVLLVGAVLLLRASAGGDLAPPPLDSLGAVGDWVDARDPATAAIALVRFAAELAGWYLLGLTALYGLASGLRSGGLASLADALAAPGAARLVRSGLGLGLLASTAAGAATTTDDRAATTSTAIMRPLNDDGTAWMVPEGAESPEDPSTSPSPAETMPTAETTPTAGSTVATARRTTWTVSSGESFWSIAEDVLEEALGRPPSDAEIDPYWRALIETNRHRLVDPADPDLIHPGQVFELPAP